MKFLDITKKDAGHYITRYDIGYETGEGTRKVYEMISRNGDLRTEADLTENAPEAVVLILTDPSGQRILLNHEFRMAVGRMVYNFPAGLIEAGESPREAAARELREETGLTLLSIDDEIGISYSAVGFCNEKNLCFVGTAGGTFRPSTSADEEISAAWHTKEEVRGLLKTELFAARTQSFCYLWSRA